MHPLCLAGIQPPLRMQVHELTDVHISAAIAASGIWEQQETRFLSTPCGPGDVFVDVGANIGYFSLLASRLVGESGTVLAFEPERDNFALLEANCRLNDCANIRCFKAALGEENASGTLYLNELNRGDHSLYPEQTGRAGQDISIVNGSRLIGASHPRVDCIKIDTQGAECDVLAGLRELIAASAAGLVMVIEFSPLLLKRAGTSGRVLLDLLAGHDWQMYLMDEAAQGLLPVSAQQVRSLSDITEQDPESGRFLQPGGQSAAPWKTTRRCISCATGACSKTRWPTTCWPSAFAPGVAAVAAAPPDNGLHAVRLGFSRRLGALVTGQAIGLKFIPGAGLASLAAPVLPSVAAISVPAEATGVYLDGSLWAILSC